jgi:hypothetical protein
MCAALAAGLFEGKVPHRLFSLWKFSFRQLKNPQAEAFATEA